MTLIQNDMTFTVVFARRLLHCPYGLLIRINSLDTPFRTNKFSQSECMKPWTAAKLSDHLTARDAGFN
jgi:hypothetical protein